MKTSGSTFVLFDRTIALRVKPQNICWWSAWKEKGIESYYLMPSHETLNSIESLQIFWQYFFPIFDDCLFLNFFLETELTDSAYSRIYGRLPIPRSYVPIAAPSRASYYGEWNWRRCEHLRWWRRHQPAAFNTSLHSLNVVGDVVCECTWPLLSLSILDLDFFFIFLFFVCVLCSFPSSGPRSISLLYLILMCLPFQWLFPVSQSRLFCNYQNIRERKREKHRWTVTIWFLNSFVFSL